jgi:hypothetical protein
MGELQFYRDIATGVLGILVIIIGYLWKTTADDVKSKLSRDEFKSYLDDAKESREALKTSIIKLFEKADNHEKLDAARFEVITKDFNGGVGRLAEKINDVQVNILTQLNNKMDKGK